MNVYRWRKRGTRRPDYPKVFKPRKEPENLVGMVHGERASDIEERLYRAFLANDVKDDDIVFQPSYIAYKNLPGEIRPDFAIAGFGLLKIFFADGEYWHKPAEQKMRDKINDAILFEILEGQADYPIRIPGEKLADQDTANATVSEYI